MKTRGLSRMAALCYGPLAILAGAWIALGSGWDVLLARLIPTRPLEEIAMGILVGGAILILSYLLRATARSVRTLERVFARTLGPLRIHQCFFLALLSAVAEELFFRGALQPLVGLTAASLIFGLLHMPFERGMWLWPLFAIAMGFILGGLYELYGTLTAPILCHFLINFLNLILIARSAGPLSELECTPAFQEVPETRLGAPVEDTGKSPTAP